MVFESPFDKEKVAKLYEKLCSYKEVKTIMLFTSEHHMNVDSIGLNAFMRFVGLIGMSLQGAYYEPFKLGHKKALKTIADPYVKIYKVMPWFGLGKKGILTARRVYDQFIKDFGDEYEIWFSGSAIEIMEKGTNKSHSLKELLKICNIKEDEVAVVGDSGNDIPLFENFEHSFVMAQALEEVKQKAKVRLKSFDDLANYIK